MHFRDDGFLAGSEQADAIFHVIDLKDQRRMAFNLLDVEATIAIDQYNSAICYIIIKAVELSFSMYKYHISKYIE